MLQPREPRPSKFGLTAVHGAEKGVSLPIAPGATEYSYRTESNLGLNPATDTGYHSKGK